MTKYYYLNNATAAYPLAPSVIEAVTQALQDIPHTPGRDVSSSPDRLGLCRESLSLLLGADTERIVLVPNATYGLNTAILGLGLHTGDLVVTTVMEHNSVLRPLAYLSDRQGVEIKYIPLTPPLSPLAKGDYEQLCKDTYEKLLQEKPRLVIMTHASNVTGRINPVAQYFKKAKAVGSITILDACQTVGRIPVKPAELNADIVVFSGYKGLRGAMSTGVLYVSPDVELNPVFTGGTGGRSDLRLQPLDMPMRFEAGTPNVPAFAGLTAAIRYYMEHTDEIMSKEAMLTERLLSGLLSIPRVRVFDTELIDRLPVISFEIQDMDCESVGYALSASFDIECRAGLHCAPLMHKALHSSGSVRFSPSYTNSIDDIDYALEAVRKLAV